MFPPELLQYNGVLKSAVADVCGYYRCKNAAQDSYVAYNNKYYRDAFINYRFLIFSLAFVRNRSIWGGGGGGKGKKKKTLCVAWPGDLTFFIFYLFPGVHSSFTLRRSYFLVITVACARARNVQARRNVFGTCYLSFARTGENDQ